MVLNENYAKVGHMCGVRGRVMQPMFKFWELHCISRTANILRLEILHAYRGLGALMKTMQK